MSRVRQRLQMGVVVITATGETIQIPLARDYIVDGDNILIYDKPVDNPSIPPEPAVIFFRPIMVGPMGGLELNKV